MTHYTRKRIFILILSYLLPNTLFADNESPWYVSTSANINLSVFSESEIIDTQTELSFFIDADYVEKFSLSAGLIYQEQKNLNNILNNILYAGGQYHIYPESMPGKVTLSIDTYHEGKNSAVKKTSNNIPGPGGGMPQTTSVTTERISNSLKIVNPVVSFMNYTKSLYADLGYAYSEYASSDTEIEKFNVKQWTPTLGFSFNDQYDWLIFRHYNIDLSNDSRSPGITKTSAYEIKLTHWVKNTDNSSLDNLQFSFLTGDRLFTVDHDARKVYNLSDMQTAALSIGGNWKYKNKSSFYIYTGLEEYKNIFSNNDYYNIFIYSGYKKNW